MDCSVLFRRALVPLLLLSMLLSMLVPLTVRAGSQVEVQALMRDVAVLRINGVQKTLRAGQASGDVRLISSTPKQAVVEIDGRRHSLALSQRISGSFAAADQSEVRIARNAHNRYLTNGEINGRRVLMLVDTGASIIGLNEIHARLLGIDYQRTGTPGHAGTASGVVPAWEVSLDRVTVGPITLHHVKAMVLSGGFPQEVLLGMTYLKHVNMREQDGVMILQQKF